MSRKERDAIPADEREALLTIARGAVITSAGYSGQHVLITAVEVVIARGLGPAAYGVYTLAWRITQLLVRFVTFGTVPALQRYLLAYEGEPQRRSSVAGLAYATTLGFGLVIATSVWFSAPRISDLSVDHPSFPATMRAFANFVVFLGVVRITAGIFRAVESAHGEVLVNKLFAPGVRLAAATLALWLGYSAAGVAAAIAVATGLLAVITVSLAVRISGIAPSLRGVRSESRRFYNHATPIALSRLGKVFQNRIDVLLVGALVSAVGAGTYNVVLVLIAVAWIPLRSFNQLLPPVASELYAESNRHT